MPNVCQLILNPVPLALSFIKIPRCSILNHLGHEVCFVLCDHILWWCFVCLIFLACTPRLYNWPLGMAFLFLGSTLFCPLFYLDPFFLFMRRLGVVLLPRLGAFLGHTPFFYCVQF